MIIYITNILDKMKFTMLDLDTFLLLGKFFIFMLSKGKSNFIKLFQQINVYKSNQKTKKEKKFPSIHHKTK